MLLEMSNLTQKNYEACKETRKFGSYTGIKLSIEIILEEVNMLDLLDKDTKSVFKDMFWELKETVSKNKEKYKDVIEPNRKYQY